MHFYVLSLHDSTVLAAWPIRKPARTILRQEHIRIDPDGVTIEHSDAGREISDMSNDTRYRSQRVIAINLNTRRAIRQLLLPQLSKALTDLDSLRAQLDRIEAMVAAANGPASVTPSPPLPAPLSAARTWSSS
jgi:hypothetical protein